MKSIYFRRGPLIAAPVMMCIWFLAGPLTGAQPSSQDSIDVIGHLELPGSTTVNDIRTSTHWTQRFLELSDYQHRTLTVVDVTDPAHPKEVKQLALPAHSTRADAEAMTGNIALLTENVSQANKASESLSIVDFTDPSHPEVVRKFDNVSAFRKDVGGIIYVAGADGLWILKQIEAPDQKLDAAYRDYILYGTR